MLIKRLQQSLLDGLHHVVAALDEAGIKTTENIIFTPVSTIFSHLGQGEGAGAGPSARDAVAEWELVQLIDACVRLTAPASTTGEDELEREEEEAFRLREKQRSGSGGGDGEVGIGWNVLGLDGLMGAWDGRGVMEICGPQRVGKSLLLLHLVLRHLTRDPTSICRWLDSDGAFSPSRARAVLDLWGVEDPAHLLERLLVVPCYSVDPHVTDAIAAINEEIISGRRTGMLVIDSITPLLRDNLMGAGAQGHASMVNLLHDLSELAYARRLSVVVTNGTASSRPSNPASLFTATDVKPALGTDMTYFSDISLLVQSTSRVFGEVDEGERDRIFNKPGLRGVVEVLKSRVSPTGRWAVFETDGKTLMDVAPAPEDDERTIRMSAGQHDTGRPAYGPLRETLA